LNHLTEPQHVKRDVRALIVMALAYPAFQGMTQTLVPLLMAELALDETTVGMVQAIPGFLALAAGAPLARLANTRWRRATLVGAFVLSIAASLFYSVATSLATLIIPQMLVGIASSAFWSNMLATSFRLAEGPRQNRIQGFITAMQGVGYFVGPLACGYLSQYNYAWGFYAGAVCGLVGVIGSSWLSPARSIEPSQGLWRDFVGSYARLYRVLTRRPSVLLGAGFVFLNCFLLYVMGGSFFLLYASQIGLTAFVASAIMSGREVMGSLVRLSFGAVSQRVRPVILLGGGTILGAITLGLLPLTSSVVGLALIAIVLGIAMAYLPPAVNVFSGASAAPEEQATAIVSLNLSNFAAQTTMAPLVGLALSSSSYRVTYPVIAIVWATLGAVVMLKGLQIARRREQEAQPAAPSPAYSAGE
jgi:MFS family permease